MYQRQRNQNGNLKKTPEQFSKRSIPNAEK